MSTIARRVSASVLGVCAAGLLTLAGGPSSAQQYPSKPIRILTGFQAGGPTDLLARVVGDHLHKVWGQPVIADARPGAAGNLASELAARAPGDGYTLVVTPITILATFKQLYGNLTYDPERDLVPITVLTNTPQVLEVNPQLPVRNFQEFAAHLKAEGKSLNFGTPGIGTFPHLAAELLKMRLGVESTHVPYRGTAPFVDAILKNEVQWAIDILGTSVTQREKIRVLAVASKTRIAEHPDVPTFTELGYPEIDPATMFLMSGPSTMPKDLVDKLAQEIGRGLNDPASAERLRTIGQWPAPTTSDEAIQIVATQRAKWLEVIRRANIKVE
jgi:tripartite-type tricarboxylate transporter receptor subunit TctC